TARHGKSAWYGTSSNLLMLVEPALVTRAAAGARGARGDGCPEDINNGYAPIHSASSAPSLTHLLHLDGVDVRGHRGGICSC
ncbi:hypothetical protein GGX14DRAFT_423590, partial [Mycena pura]